MGISGTLHRVLGGMSAAPSTAVRAVWHGRILAESDATVVVEGIHYFPSDAIRRELFEPSDRTSVCPWKGTARYYDVVIEGDRNPDAAWYYRSPQPAAAELKDRVAFRRGVRVEPMRAAPLEARFRAPASHRRAAEGTGGNRTTCCGYPVANRVPPKGS